ncbi:MAG: O-antigen ligase family protein [Actinomycetota bacterium]|nr:O-antigen ligase family protein [Actinomycetota bacterium]
MDSSLLFGMTVPGPSVLLGAAVVGVVVLTAWRAHLARLAVWAVLAGWFVFAITSPSSQFPLALRPLSLVVAATGAVVYRFARPPSDAAGRAPVALPTRLLVVYLAFVLLGCLASPYGPTNAIRWVEGVLIVGAGCYAVSLGLTKKILAATALGSLANVALTVRSGAPEVLKGVTGPARLAGFMQPNHLAFAAGIVLIGAAWLWPRRPTLRLLLIACSGLAMYALVASRSRTGLLALLIAVGLAVVAECAGRGRGARVAVWALLVIVLSLPVALPAFNGWFNRDSASGGSEEITSLTGRTDFWPFAIDLIKQRPYTGWGVDTVSSPVGVRFQAVLPGVSQAHNSYLEAGLMGGIPAAFAWGASLLGVVIGAWRLPRSDSRRFLLIGGSIFLQFYAFTESSPAWFGDMFVIYVLLVAVYGEARNDALRGARARRPTASDASSAGVSIAPDASARGALTVGAHQ